MYRIVGPDGRETEEVALATVQDWVASGQLPSEAVVVRPDGSRVAAGQMDELLGFFAMAAGAQSSSATRTPTPLDVLIPAGNPKALAAYYLGLACLFPCIGILVVPFVFFLAKKGMDLYRQHPSVRGKGHAIAGFVFASLGLVINGTILIWVFTQSSVGS